MHPAMSLLRLRSCVLRPAWLCALAGTLVLAMCLAARAQQPANPSTTQAPQQPAAPSAAEPAPSAATPSPSQAAPTPAESQHASADAEQGGITEDEIRQMLVGKPLYLRGGYLDDSLSFNEHGALIGHSSQGSYTLCGVQIDKVRLTKHKVEFIGARYGLHFLGALAYEDPSTAVDRVRITPKKKVLKITIDREVVVKPKKKKEDAKRKTAATAPEETAQDADQARAEIAAAAPEERPADPNSVTTTTSPAHAAQVLKDALGVIFAQGLDDRMKAAMPDFWQLYYEAAAAKTDFRPQDPAVLRQNMVDTKAKLLTTFEPSSNEYAQASGVAGMALYHAVIGPDGKPTEIAVARPIGFGLDENAVAAIRQAKFEPAMKGGQPVPVLLDLVVQFRIYSKRTAETNTSADASKPAEPSLPGPYSIQHAPEQPQQ